ncbi:fragile X mental retardation 1 neighbor protein isoform X3 [Sarcophilus harrisii]|uniref:fragile X mental retardation 1 neighbor protein isoform X3 n=1 Tax=Sarcophilus harrisii TaxID=9305 RepID=UPI00130201BA|nr:fragile X mental retardation 1 neighbor protein isoform X3 [Sarcophilus harrisii]
MRVSEKGRTMPPFLHLVYMRLLFFVFGLCAIRMLCACDDVGVAVQFDNILEREAKSIHDTETILGPQDDTGHFFYPKTCRVNEGEQVEPCQGNQDLNKTMCLKSNCCFSSKDKDETTSCYTPVVDNVQLTLRFFVIGIVCLILLGCLPICCCILCQQRYRTAVFVPFIKNTEDE